MSGQPSVVHYVLDTSALMAYLAGEEGEQAAEIKAYHPLSLADAWIAALALNRSAVLVHKDPEFEALSGLIHLLPLPYKKG